MAKRSTAERGYGWDHQQERRRWAPAVARGEASCTRCHGFIIPGTPWDLDHTSDRTGYLGVAHARCNRRAGARKAAARRTARARRRTNAVTTLRW